MSLTPTVFVPQSPCVRNCCLDDDDVCMGCGRSITEITQWSAASLEDKQKILYLAAERRQSILLRQQGA